MQTDPLSQPFSTFSSVPQKVCKSQNSEGVTSVNTEYHAGLKNAKMWHTSMKVPNKEKISRKLETLFLS